MCTCEKKGEYERYSREKKHSEVAEVLSGRSGRKGQSVCQRTGGGRRGEQTAAVISPAESSSSQHINKAFITLP